jgi:ureidoglycolate hydrolase
MRMTNDGTASDFHVLSRFEQALQVARRTVDLN